MHQTHSTMKSPFPSTLNPFAPEYNRIPPGVNPDPHAPPPPPPTSFLPPPPPPPPEQPYQTPNFPYPVLPPPTHTLTTFYYHAPHSFSTTPPPPPPPPRPWPLLSPPRRGRERRDFRRERKYERASWSKYGRSISMHRGEKLRHNVLPLKKDEEKTTVMIKNIPYACPRKELISVLDIFCSRENSKSRIEGTSQASGQLSSSVAYDFLYLPIDFRTRKSRGFAFVNFTNACAVWKFYDAFHLGDWGSVEENRKWPKKIEIVCAKIQGKEALVDHFSGSIFDCETDEYLPVVFNPPRDGSGQHCKLTVIGKRRAFFLHRETRSNHMT